ncbi:MAG: L,D-transpeptidase [Polyangiales bacterium]
MHSGRHLLACAAGVLLVSVVFAQSAPLPTWVRGLEAQKPEIPVYAAADERAPRRGTLLLGARLPPYARAVGAGCGDGNFVALGPDAFACERDLTPVADPVVSTKDPAQDNLPFEYLQTSADATNAYAATDDYFTGEYTTVLGKGFVVAVAGRVGQSGVGFVRTLSGLYVREHELRPMRASLFAGVHLQHGELASQGFVIAEGAEVRAAPGGAVVRRAKRLEHVTISGEPEHGWLQLGDATYLPVRAVARPELRPPPAELVQGERFIDVDLARQILVAYQGAEPVFVTLISSGKPGTRTPRGAFRIWVKLRESDMRDSERYALEQSYAIEHVPWVQYFKQGFALHAAFWHDRFGETHSRGCVNLSPSDARFLFELTSPALPAGWFAVHPTASERGTLVMVH